MGKTINLGGNRIGSGSKINVALKGFERSTHDLSYIWRSTMANGTLVPFMNLIALPGDTFDINLNADVKTLPTLAPLFGSFKLQLDIYLCPMRLYNRQLHNNTLGVGLEMNKIKFPIIKLKTTNPYYGNTISNEENINEFQISQSSLLAYMGIRGIGHSNVNVKRVEREFNAMPFLAYWDIYKNYYANKQEGKGAVLNNKSETETKVTGYNAQASENGFIKRFEKISITGEHLILKNIIVSLDANDFNASDKTMFNVITNSENLIILEYLGDKKEFMEVRAEQIVEEISKLEISTFDLKNIDEMRENLLSHPKTSPYEMNDETYQDEEEFLPYNTLTAMSSNGEHLRSKKPMQGLALKTYQSDIFNNWLDSETIDGVNGIAQVTAIDTSDGKFTIDTLNIAKKVYDMLNRIAVSGGTYDDWVEAVYDHETYGKPESPIYMGGLSQEIVFQQVVATANSEESPLGSLAGRGNLSEERKGGNITIKVNEPAMIIGIASITPRIDYSQGNDWTMNLKTMDDLHKPNLDEIGFQDLITDQMAWFDTSYDEKKKQWIFNSAGKQPAWLNYMTNFNKCYGEFANQNSQMFMTLNRRYECKNGKIKDLTTYIDPEKFNYIFAQADRTAQNFWLQIASNITARRKMSAKLMPNL